MSKRPASPGKEKLGSMGSQHMISRIRVSYWKAKAPEVQANLWQNMNWGNKKITCHVSGAPPKGASIRSKGLLITKEPCLIKSIKEKVLTSSAPAADKTEYGEH